MIMVYFPGMRFHALRRFQHQENDPRSAGTKGRLLAVKGRLKRGQGPDPQDPGGEREEAVHAAADHGPHVDEPRPTGRERGHSGQFCLQC